MRKKRILKLTAAAVLLLVIYCIWGTYSLQTSHFVLTSSKVPQEFDGFVIVQISDLHNREFGRDQNRLLSEIRVAEPDIIVVTGDLTDRRTPDIETAMKFISGAAEIAPVYYVTGNHEAWSEEFPELKKRIDESGIYFMDDKSVQIVRGGRSVRIIGLSDPAFFLSEYERLSDTSNITQTISTLSDPDFFQILLSHRPELIDIYKEQEIDLVFSGHTHGGQIRLPFIGALYAPDQGFFPEYAAGQYAEGSTVMIVSRGLGNSTFMPFRFMNRPEIVVLTLLCE